MNVDVVHHLLVAFLVFAFPIWDRRETRYLKTGRDPRRRINSYAKTIAWQLVIVALLVATLPFAELWRPPALPDLPERARGLALGVLIGVGVATVFGSLLPFWSKGARAHQVEALRSVDFFLPRGATERRWFAAVAITVGVCEEIIFRGFLIRYFLAVAPALGLAGAALAAAVVFGIDHGYQGWRGMIGTALLALVFTLLFLATGSLLVPIIVHALLDLRLLLFSEAALADDGVAPAA